MIELSFNQRRRLLRDAEAVTKVGTRFPHHVSLGFLAEGSLDLDVLQHALDAIVRRHDSLRTVIAESHCGLDARIAPHRPLSLRCVDLRALPPESKDEEAIRLARKEASELFDLADGQLVRGLAIRLDEQRHAVVITVEHLVADGRSAEILARELSEVYAATRRREEPSLPELPLQYHEWARWQRDTLAGDTLGELVSYWREKLGPRGLWAELPLPPDAGSRASERRTMSEVIALDAGVGSRIEDLARRLRVTPFILLLTVVKTLLHLRFGMRDISVASPVANRGHPHTENVVGWFATVLPFRTEVTGDPTFAEFTQAVRDTAIGTFANEQLPFALLVEKLAPDVESRPDNPRSLLFTIERPEDAVPQFEAVDVRPFEFGLIDAGMSMLPLVLRRDRDVWTLRVDYTTDLFEPDTVRWMIAPFPALLESVVEAPERQLSRLAREQLA